MCSLHPCPLSKSGESQNVCLCMYPVSNLGFWPLQTLCCSPPVSLEVWCSLSQCRASSGASAAAAEPAPTQVQDLAETTHTTLTRCKADYTNKGGEVALSELGITTFKALWEHAFALVKCPWARQWISNSSRKSVLELTLTSGLPVEDYRCQRGPKQNHNYKQYYDNVSYLYSQWCIRQL